MGDAESHRARAMSVIPSVKALAPARLAPFGSPNSRIPTSHHTTRTPSSAPQRAPPSLPPNTHSNPPPSALPPSRPLPAGPFSALAGPPRRPPRSSRQVSAHHGQQRLRDPLAASTPRTSPRAPTVRGISSPAGNAKEA